MAYNLPPPWDSGYALPANVLDEGLRRRAFVTKQMPRGTYYQSNVGTGGYVVPQYILDEGYGQGAFTTKWAPSGSYPGKAIPYWLNQRPQTVADRSRQSGGQAVTIQRGLSGVSGEPAMAEPFETYGQRAATVLMSKMARLPPSHRKSTLKATLDAVDPSLWKRTAEIARRYNNQGMTAAQALHQGLARAMSTGIAAELINTGLRRTAPQSRSLLGLGCYDCAAQVALGAPMGLGITSVRQEDGGAQLGSGTGRRRTTTTTTANTSTTTSEPTATTTTSPPDQPPPAAEAPPEGSAPTTAVVVQQDPSTYTCDPPAGYTWASGVPGIPDHWERLKVGATPAKGPCGTTSAVREHTEDLWVGPWGFYTDKLRARDWASGGGNNANRASVPDVQINTPGQLSTDQLAWLKARLTEAKDGAGNEDVPVHYTDPDATYGYPEPDAAPWFTVLGIDPTTPVRMHALSNLRLAVRPFGKAKSPKGQDMVLHVMLARRDWTRRADATNNPFVVKVWLSGIPDPTMWASIWNALPSLAANVVAPLTEVVGEAIKDGLKAIGDLACDLLSNPASGLAAGGAAAVAGVPPQAGIAGAQIAKQQCGQPAPPLPPVAPKSSMMPVALLVGGGVLAAILLTRKKR